MLELALSMLLLALGDGLLHHVHHLHQQIGANLLGLWLLWWEGWELLLWLIRRNWNERLLLLLLLVGSHNGGENLLLVLLLVDHWRGNNRLICLLPLINYSRAVNTILPSRSLPPSAIALHFFRAGDEMMGVF